MQQRVGLAFGLAILAGANLACALLDGGPDGGACAGNCPPAPCPPTGEIGEPCCDVEGNVVSESTCFEDAGVSCWGGGDTFNCRDD